MTVIKTPEEAAQVLSSLKIGEETIFNYNPKWRVTRVNGGWLYSSDYNGVTFVPDAPKEQPKKEAVIIPPPIKPMMEEKKVTKPARKVVTK